MTVGDLIARLQKVPAEYGVHFEGEIIIEIKRGSVAMFTKNKDMDNANLGRGVGSRWVPLSDFVNNSNA